jgi:hypothetical protein
VLGELAVALVAGPSIVPMNDVGSMVDYHQTFLPAINGTDAASNARHPIRATIPLI